MEIQTKEQHPVVAYAESLGVEYGAEFVPYSNSRSYHPGAKMSEKNLNWRLYLRKPGGARFICDYSQGIGHLPEGAYKPSYARGVTLHEAEAIDHATEHGRAYKKSKDGKDYQHRFDIPLKKPALEDVLHSLVLDYDVMQYACFEDWAREVGYDTDSRAAEETYRECLKQSLALRLIFNDAEIQKIRELTEDL